MKKNKAQQILVSLKKIKSSLIQYQWNAEIWNSDAFDREHE